jgi:hypothetical protein
MVPLASGNDIEGVKLLIAKTEEENVFRLTIANEGTKRTESFFRGLSTLVEMRVLRPDGSVQTRATTGLFGEFTEIPPGQDISVTRTAQQFAGTCKLNGTYKVQMLYRNLKSNVVSFEFKPEDGKEPDKSQVAEDVVEWYRMMGKNVGLFDRLMGPAEDEVGIDTRKSLIRWSKAQIDFFSLVERKFGEEANKVNWIFAWSDTPMADDFLGGKIEVSETLETATVEPKGWGMKFYLRLGPTDHWIVDVKTFSESEFRRNELVSSAEKLNKVKLAIEKDEYASLKEVVQAVNTAFKRAAPQP